MVTERAQALLEALRADVASGRVFNADFEDAKRFLGNAVYHETALRNLLLSSGDGSGSRTDNRTYPGISKLYWALPSNVHEIASASKKYAKCRDKCPANVVEAADAFFAVWLPVNELFAKAKTMLVKGRRPSEEVDDSERRSLENTGTCGVCGGNFKRNTDGGLVNHGYRIKYHSFEGGCPGVGFEPFEISPKGAEAYADGLQIYIKDLETEYEAWKANGLPRLYSERLRAYLVPEDAAFEKEFRSLLSSREFQLRQLRSNLSYYRAKIAAWEPRPLPGVVAGFEK